MNPNQNPQNQPSSVPPMPPVQSGSQKSSHKTLIIVLSIIGGLVLIGLIMIPILSSIVLVSLNTARTKGDAARVQALLSSIRPAAEVYYANTKNSYSIAHDCQSGMFADPASISPILGALAAYSPKCDAEGQTYAVSAIIPTDHSSICIDSAGYMGVGTLSTTKSSVSCVK